MRRRVMTNPLQVLSAWACWPKGAAAVDAPVPARAPSATVELLLLLHAASPSTSREEIRFIKNLLNWDLPHRTGDRCDRSRCDASGITSAPERPSYSDADGGNQGHFGAVRRQPSGAPSPPWGAPPRCHVLRQRRRYSGTIH